MFGAHESMKTRILKEKVLKKGVVVPQGFHCTGVLPTGKSGSSPLFPITSCTTQLHSELYWPAEFNNFYYSVSMLNTNTNQPKENYQPEIFFHTKFYDSFLLHFTLVLNSAVLAKLK